MEKEQTKLQAENEANGTTFNPDNEEETTTLLPDEEVAELDMNEILAICQSAMRGNIYDLLKLNKFNGILEERERFQRKVLDEVARRMNFVRGVYREHMDAILNGGFRRF